MLTQFSIIVPIIDDKHNFDLIGCLQSLKMQTTSKSYEVVCVLDKKLQNPNQYEYTIKNEFGFKILNCPESGFDECLNFGIKNSDSSFIIPVKQPTIFKTDALDILWNNYKDYDVIYSSDHNVELDSLYNINIFLINRVLINELPYWFEQYYYPYDFDKFLMHCILNNLKIGRIRDNIVWKTINISGRSEKIDNIVYNLSNSNSRELTCIIPFRNEGSEVERTILSIYATSKNTTIVLINDCSDDTFNYSFIKTRYPNIKFIENKYSIGHGNIDLGVINSDTPYCILLDAHMRLYEQDWDNRILEVLKTHPNSIVYGNTVIMYANDGIYYNEDNSEKPINNLGSKVMLNPKSSENIGIFQHKWIYNSAAEDKDEIVHITPNILGACYAFSKEHYWNIGGTYGLFQYGLSEAALAVKTWLMGGEVYRIQDLFVGHVYRSKFPYKMEGYSSFLNDRFLIYLYIQDSKFRDECLEFSQNRLGRDDFKQSLNILWDKHKDKLLKYVNHYKIKFVHDIHWFEENINSKFS